MGGRGVIALISQCVSLDAVYWMSEARIFLLRAHVMIGTFLKTTCNTCLVKVLTLDEFGVIDRSIQGYPFASCVTRTLVVAGMLFRRRIKHIGVVRHFILLHTLCACSPALFIAVSPDRDCYRPTHPFLAVST
jgi:hypothetical protein